MFFLTHGVYLHRIADVSYTDGVNQWQGQARLYIGSDPVTVQNAWHGCNSTNAQLCKNISTHYRRQNHSLGFFTVKYLFALKSIMDLCARKVRVLFKGAITSKVKHAIKLKTTPAKLAQLLRSSLAFCFSLQPMTAYRPVLDGTPSLAAS